MTTAMANSTVPPRRVVLLALVAGLSLAGVVAIGAILSNSFDRTDLRVVATSLGFSIFSALAAAGARVGQRGTGPAALGRATTIGAVISFALLLAALWVDHDAVIWQVFGTVGVATLAGSHACLVLSASRVTDSSLISRLATISIGAGSTDSILGMLTISGAMKHVSASYVQLLAVLGIVTLVTTALPPLLRRLASKPEPHPSALPVDSGAAHALASRASELLAIAARLDSISSTAGQSASEIQTETARLRRIAATVDRSEQRRGALR